MTKEYTRDQVEIALQAIKEAGFPPQVTVTIAKMCREAPECLESVSLLCKRERDGVRFAVEMVYDVPGAVRLFSLMADGWQVMAHMGQWVEDAETERRKVLKVTKGATVH